jgi:hypothetical protein
LFACLFVCLSVCLFDALPHKVNQEKRNNLSSMEGPKLIRVHIQTQVWTLTKILNF